MKLNEQERLRYQKQLLLPEIGEEGQLKLKSSSILVVGAGGLGSPVLLYLAAAGIGHIGIVDGDRLELSNLQRQVVHDTHDLGSFKVESAYRKMHDLNPEIEIDIHAAPFTESNAAELTVGRHCVVDCTDNLETRFLINSTCVNSGIPFVFGAIYRCEGQVSVFDARRGPCFRCLYPVIPSGSAVPDPKVNGLLGTVPGLIGVMQATEVIKLLLDIGEPLIGNLLLYDALAGTFKTVKISKLTDCPVCGKSS
jgi:adenylyltransferase/sulfurtransferase